MIKRVNPEDVHTRMQAGDALFLVDVREPGEYDEVHANEAINIPLGVVSAETLAEKGITAADQVFLICRSGARSMRAAEALSEQGFEKLFNVEGGTLAWVDQNLPHS